MYHLHCGGPVPKLGEYRGLKTVGNVKVTAPPVPTGSSITISICKRAVLSAIKWNTFSCVKSRIKYNLLMSIQSIDILTTEYIFIICAHLYPNCLMRAVIRP